MINWLFTLVLVVCLAPALPAQIKDDVFAQYRSEVDKAVERGWTFWPSVSNRRATTTINTGNRAASQAWWGWLFLQRTSPWLGEHGATLNRCIDFVLTSQQKNGLLDRADSGHGPMYSHNIGTLFLSECSGMVDQGRQDRIEDALARATQLLLRAQAVPKDENNAGMALQARIQRQRSFLQRLGADGLAFRQAERGAGSR